MNPLDQFIKAQIQVLAETKKTTSWKRRVCERFFQFVNVSANQQIGPVSPSHLKRSSNLIDIEVGSKGTSKKAKKVSSVGESLPQTGKVEVTRQTHQQQ